MGESVAFSVRKTSIVTRNIEQQDWHGIEPEAVAEVLGVDLAQGLGPSEIVRRQQVYGRNQLPAAKKRSMGVLFASQFLSPLIYILFLAAVVAFSLGHRSDAIVILVVVLINAVIGAFQEGRAERSMESLRRLSDLRVRVRRDGHEEVVEARDLVPGDVTIFAAGDAIAADARLLEAASLEIAEAALTGESLPVEKVTDCLPTETLLADRRNMLYSGTHVVSGRGTAVIVATGLATEVGEISSLTTTAKDTKTPLEKRIHQFGHYLVATAVLLFLVVVSIGLLRGLPLFEILMIAISQMVSMVPEGLPVAMTIALAVGMQRMAAQKVIVRRLAAVETLGSTSVICSDKTGTLTRNEMTVTALWLPDGRVLQVTGAGYSPDGEVMDGARACDVANDPAMSRMIEAVTLCNDAELVRPDSSDSRWRALGDPTEAALLTLARKCGVEPDQTRNRFTRRAEIPFDSEFKMMATENHEESRSLVCIKGAPEAVVGLCTHAGTSDDDRIPLSDSKRAEIDQVGAEFANRALRLIAVAEVHGGRIDESKGVAQFDGKARLLGLIGQLDPPREEAVLAIRECLQAGIRPVMVTGDHKATGLAVARAIGIAKAGDLAIDGYELEAMSETVLMEQLDRVAVFARVHPAQKLRIVKAFQSRNNVVAMTGDGVNDAPALAVADVGVAMGITGTEVAKGAAKIVIADDNFATIVKGVEQGRLVYRNLKKVILYLFATSMAEVGVLLGALCLGFPVPLVAVQILWINIVTEGTVTVNLIMEPAEGDEMLRAPVSRNEPLLDRSLLYRVLLMTPSMALSSFAYFAWCLASGMDLVLARTETFTVLAVCQWFNVLNCRSETQSALNFGLLKNYWLLGGLIIGNLLHFLVIYTEPLNRIFYTEPIPLPHVFLIGAVASTVLWVEELRKFFKRRLNRKTVSHA